MSRNRKRAALASLVVGLGFAGPAALANPLADLFDMTDVGRVVETDLPAITDNVDDGLGSLLGDTGLLGGILGGTDELLGGVLGSLGLASDPEVSIQPVPPMQGSLAEPKVGGGLLGGLFGLSSLTDSLAGRL